MRYGRSVWQQYRGSRGEAMWRIIKFASITVLCLQSPNTPSQKKKQVCRSARTHCGRWVCGVFTGGWRRWQKFPHQKWQWESKYSSSAGDATEILGQKHQKLVLVLAMWMLELHRVVTAVHCAQAGPSAPGCSGQINGGNIGSELGQLHSMLHDSCTITVPFASLLLLCRFLNTGNVVTGKTTLNTAVDKENKCIFLKTQKIMKSVLLKHWACWWWHKQLCCTQAGYHQHGDFGARMYAIADSHTAEKIPNEGGCARSIIYQACGTSSFSAQVCQECVMCNIREAWQSSFLERTMQLRWDCF